MNTPEQNNLLERIEFHNKVIEFLLQTRRDLNKLIRETARQRDTLRSELSALGTRK